MINVYSRKTCQICEVDFIFSETPPDRICPNGCCEVIVSDFDDRTIGIYMNFEPSDEDDEPCYYQIPEERDELIERIKYWKEDYRYLAEILERS